jgi:nicotinamide phosphoribosyltransferase
MNPMLLTDVYKMGHCVQYKKGCDYVYSGTVARSNKHFDRTLFVGLQYYLAKYLSKPLWPWMAEEFLRVHKRVVGTPPQKLADSIRAIADLGYWPLKIKAVPEGTVISPKNILMTIATTHKDFYWAGGFVESLLLKIAYPICVASTAYKYRQLVRRYWRDTVGHENGLDFAVHDFGYRGDHSEEGAAISGGAFLSCFVGSDCVPAFPYLEDYYDAQDDEDIMLSVPASEHSVACSFGPNGESDYLHNMLDLYPTGIVSIVSDTYNLWDLLVKTAGDARHRIMSREGKVVFRPDSGDPVKIINGDPDSTNVAEQAGVLRILADTFGSKFNAKGYKELDPHVGLIYGDGMHYERFSETLDKMADNKFAANNLIIGVGSLLRWHTRDTIGLATKATAMGSDGIYTELMKDPYTDPGKKSYKGFMHLACEGNEYSTTDQVSKEMEDEGHLETVFEDGFIMKRTNLKAIREKVRSYESGIVKALS